MRIAVFSDSHGNWEVMRDFLDYLLHIGPIDKVAFCGDGVVDFHRLKESYAKKLPGAEWLCVAGNNDPAWEDTPLLRVFTVNGVTVMLTHGHRQGVRFTSGLLVKEAKRQNAQVVLFGHTHSVFQNTMDGVLLLNPGTVGMAFDRPTAMVLEITQDGAFHAEKYEL